MQFKIRLVTAPGDKSVERAAIKVVDKDGAFLEGQIVLEGETVEAEVTLSAGQTIEVTELIRPTVYDIEQKAAVPMDLTPEDKLKKRVTPPTTPEPKQTVKEHDPHGMGKVPDDKRR